MRNLTFYLFMLALSYFYSVVYSQNQTEVSKPQLEIQDDKLVILYEIKNYKPGEKYKVWIDITDSQGKTINAKSLTGDIGDNISGGQQRKIFWSYKKDDFNTDTEIHVQVSAELIAPLEIAETNEVIESDEKVTAKEYKSGMIILQSAVFPGLGFVSMDKSKLHLTKGLAAYGCLASSIILNKKAVSNYNKYLESYEITDSDNYYKKSVDQDNLSKVFAYSAIAIWTTEMIWIILDLNANDNLFSRNGKGLSIEPGYDSERNVSMISLSYNF